MNCIFLCRFHSCLRYLSLIRKHGWHYYAAAKLQFLVKFTTRNWPCRVFFSWLHLRWCEMEPSASESTMTSSLQLTHRGWQSIIAFVYIHRHMASPLYSRSLLSVRVTLKVSSRSVTVTIKNKQKVKYKMQKITMWYLAEIWWFLCVKILLNITKHRAVSVTIKLLLDSSLMNASKWLKHEGVENAVRSINSRCGKHRSGRCGRILHKIWEATSRK